MHIKATIRITVHPGKRATVDAVVAVAIVVSPHDRASMNRRLTMETTRPSDYKQTGTIPIVTAMVVVDISVIVVAARRREVSLSLSR